MLRNGWGAAGRSRWQKSCFGSKRAVYIILPELPLQLDSLLHPAIQSEIPSKWSKSLLSTTLCTGILPRWRRHRRRVLKQLVVQLTSTSKNDTPNWEQDWQFLELKRHSQVKSWAKCMHQDKTKVYHSPHQRQWHPMMLSSSVSQPDTETIQHNGRPSLTSLVDFGLPELFTENILVFLFRQLHQVVVKSQLLLLLSHHGFTKEWFTFR